MESQHIKGNQIYVVSTSKNSQGYKDFINQIKLPYFLFDSIFLSPDMSESAIPNKLHDLPLKEADILCIVRGGGDTSHATFQPFHSVIAKDYLHELKRQGVIIITGIGHFTDEFIIERASTFNEAMPTAAAYI
ncbi:MAG: exodeoxyribonuclease VII large subunit [Desulfobacterales bacterium]|nr:exodeoxyribonuclease VII large subunit [Desulfobacterales bacterium]